MKTDNSKIVASILRQKAEEQFEKSKKITGNNVNSESEVQKLIHELQVHQIELEMQNEELVFAKEQAEHATEKYSNLFDFAPSGYITLSKECKILELNFCAAGLLGKERSRLINNSFTFFVSIETRPIFNLFFEKLFVSQTKETCEVILLIGNNLPIYVHLIGIVDEHREQCLLTIINITDRKQADIIIKKQNNELEKLNSDKDRFLSILGHDLRGPFSTIVGFSDLLMRNIRKYDIEKIENYVYQINQSTKKGFNLLEDLLTWANIQTGNLKFNPQISNFRTICKEVIEILKPNANQKNITIYNVANEDLTVFADINMLKTILRNLISNATKFTNNGGEIIISAIQLDNKITISVSDNGIGIEAKYIDQLFNITKTCSTKGTANEDGLGLGLILCNEFVEKHQGRIWVESEIDKGSSFHFTLKQIEKSNFLKTINWAHKNILFVDDELINNILIEEQLKDTNVQIAFAKNGKEAVELSSKNHYDIIIMDLNMPVMNGYEATEKIRGFNKEIMIIAHTCNVLQLYYCKAIGFTDYLQKSGNIENLIPLLTKYFE